MEGFGCFVDFGFGFTCENSSADSLRLDDAPPDSVNWSWRPYIAPALTDFGDPLTTTSYDFCVIDYDTATPTGPLLLFAAAMPAGSSWRQTHSGFYFRSADKKMRARIKTGSGGGQPKVLLRAKGPVYDVAYLPPLGTVEVLLHTSDGVTPSHCFASFFGPPITSTETKYKAQNPTP